MTASFEWDLDKDVENQRKHGVDFIRAQQAFLDPNHRCRLLAQGQADL